MDEPIQHRRQFLALLFLQKMAGTCYGDVLLTLKPTSENSRNQRAVARDQGFSGSCP